MKKIMITLAVYAAFTLPASAHVSYQSNLDYATVFYGDYINFDMDTGWLGRPPTVPYVVHNRNAEVYGDVYAMGIQHLKASVEKQSGMLTGHISLSGQDGRDFIHTPDGTNEYPSLSCGKSSVIILGSWTPSGYGYSPGTPLFMNMSVTPNGHIGDFENYYFKMFNGNQLLTELDAGMMLDTVYFNAGDRLTFEMYALEDDFYADDFSASGGYSRNFLFSAAAGGPVSAVPVPGSLLLGSVGMSIVSILRKRIQHK